MGHAGRHVAGLFLGVMAVLFVVPAAGPAAGVPTDQYPFGCTGPGQPATNPVCNPGLYGQNPAATTSGSGAPVARAGN